MYENCTFAASALHCIVGCHFCRLSEILGAPNFRIKCVHEQTSPRCCINMKYTKYVIQPFYHCSIAGIFPFYSSSQSCGKQLLAWSCLSLRLSAWNSSAPVGQIFMKFDSLVCLEKL
jgi:hypothetical protein